MDNMEFKSVYSDYLAHKWVTSKDKAKAEAQKRAEQEYNKKYYREHKQEIIDQRRKQQAANDLNRYNRNFTPEEALADLNSRQTNTKTPTQSKLFGGGMADTIYQNRVKMYQAQGMSNEDAKKKVNNERLSAIAEQMDVDRRNAIAKRTGLAQGKGTRASEAYKKQQSTLKRRSESDTKTSIAQAEAAGRRRAASQTTEAKIKRSIDRAAKRVSDVVNGGKASVQKAKDYYNSAKASISRISDFTKKTINKYFG